VSFVCLILSILDKLEDFIIGQLVEFELQVGVDLTWLGGLGLLLFFLKDFILLFDD